MINKKTRFFISNSSFAMILYGLKHKMENANSGLICHAITLSPNNSSTAGVDPLLLMTKTKVRVTGWFKRGFDNQ